MFRTKLVSVIMPVYNAERYVEEAMDSILNQTYGNFEFIIINDGSTDGSYEILQNYSKRDKRIILINRQNKGLVYTLNEGLHLAKGSYLAIMHADDSSYRERLSKQVDMLNCNPNLYLVGTNFELMLTEGVNEQWLKEMKGFEKSANEIIDSKNRFSSLLEGYKILHPTWMMRRELIDAIGPYANYAAEDTEFLFRAAIKGYDMDKVNEVLLKYRIHDISKGAVEGRLINKTETIEYKLEYLESLFNENFKKISYIIWGADISGDLAYQSIQKRLPEAKLLAYIDGYKSGELNGIRIVPPSQLDQFDYDYVFICTRSGARNASQVLLEKGKLEIRDYFKIS